MNFLRIITLFVLTNCCPIGAFAQYIQVDDSYTSQQLIETILINSSCANATNFTSSGNTFSPGEQSFGYFKNNSGNFPFKEGIVLCTSRANRAEGPNNNLIDEGQNAWKGDADLEQALNITDTYNATILEFDFIPQTSSFSFNYIFASEEYQGNAPCKYSDGFAFLLKEANTTNQYQNLAVIPNTNTPVFVTNIHPEISGGCPASNENYFGGYNTTNAPINYNGQTVVMTAKAKVIPGVKYHIKLVIADHENIRYDSAIFLEAGSFNVGVDLGPNQLIATNNPVCTGKSYRINTTETGNNSYKWYKNDILIPNESNAFYNVTSDGKYTVAITSENSACIANGEVSIEYEPTQNLISTTLVQCDDDKDGKTIFDLTKADAIIKNNDATLGTINYYKSLTGAQNQDVIDLITTPTNFQSSTTTVYASVTNSFGCNKTTSVLLQISNNKLPLFVDFEKCDVDSVKDGFFGFSLTEADELVLKNLPSGLIVDYFESMSDALLQKNKLPTIYINKIRYETTIYARIKNGSDCYGIIPVQLFANSHTPKNFGDEFLSICEGKNLKLEVAPSFESYKWSNGDTTPFITVNTSGEYTVTVEDINTCLATKKFTVTSTTQSPTITNISINDFQGEKNSVLIQYNGGGDNLFSLDGIHFQESPYFTNVSAGIYTAWVKNDCGVDSQIIYVLNYPKFFTPNGDGINDTWRINNIENLPYSKITIFDRYGQLIYQFTKNDEGWNGKVNTKKAPSTDYWFEITLDNNKIIRGHFTLKR